MRGVKAETSGATRENRGGDRRSSRARFPSHASGAWTVDKARPCHPLGEPAMATLKSVAQRWVPRGCCRRCDEVCADNSGRCGVNAAQKRAASRPLGEGGRQPRLGVSTSIPPGSRKGTRARLTRLGQIGGLRSVLHRKAMHGDDLRPAGWSGRIRGDVTDEASVAQHRDDLTLLESGRAQKLPPHRLPVYQLDSDAVVVGVAKCQAGRDCREALAALV